MPIICPLPRRPMTEDEFYALPGDPLAPSSLRLWLGVIAGGLATAAEAARRVAYRPIRRPARGTEDRR